MQQFAVRQIDKDTYAGERMEDPKKREPRFQFLRRKGAGRDEEASDKGVSCEFGRHQGETESLQHKPGKSEPEKKKEEEYVRLFVNLLRRTEQEPSHTGYDKSEKKGETEAVAPNLDENRSIAVEEITRHAAIDAKIMGEFQEKCGEGEECKGEKTEEDQKMDEPAERREPE